MEAENEVELPAAQRSLAVGGITQPCCGRRMLGMIDGLLNGTRSQMHVF